MAVGDTAFGKVVGRHFNVDAVANHHADTELPHLSFRLSDDFMAVFQPYLKHRIRQFVDYRAAKIDQFFFQDLTPSSA